MGLDKGRGEDEAESRYARARGPAGVPEAPEMTPRDASPQPASRCRGRGVQGEFRILDQAVWLPLRLIRPNPGQPRERFEHAALRRLADHIERTGVIHPIRVRRVRSHYQLIVGERRVRAAGMAGLAEIPAIIEHDTAVERDALTVWEENQDREGLGPAERARALQLLRQNLGSPDGPAPWEQVARAVGLTRRQVLNIVGVLALAEPVQARLAGMKSGEKLARPLRRLRDEHAQLAFLDVIERFGLSGDAAIQLEKAARHVDQPDLTSLARDLSRKANPTSKPTPSGQLADEHIHRLVRALESAEPRAELLTPLGDLSRALSRFAQRWMAAREEESEAIMRAIVSPWLGLADADVPATERLEEDEDGDAWR